MAQEPEQGRNASGIARAGKRKWGYDPSQVDAFLERAHALYDSDDAQLSQQDIQNVSFDLRKNGYVIAQVDAALARLERAVVDKQTTREIRQNGRVAWKAQTEELYREISTHASRAAKERFRPGAKKAPSYDRKQVDRLVDQIVDKAAAELGVDGVTEDDVRKLVDLNSNSVANVIFTQRKGKHGYDERQVDNYLNACVRLLSRLESYARVADYVNDDGGQRNAAASASAAGAPTVASLFPDTQASAAATSAMPQSYAPSSSSSSDFDALSKAEQAIFTAPADAAATSVASTPGPVQSTPEPSVTPAQTAARSMPPSFAPEPASSASGAGSGSAPAADEPSATETASWTPDFASMPPISTPAPTAASAQSSAQPASTAAYTSPFSAPSTDAASTAAPASYTPADSATSSYTPPSYTPSSSTTSSYAPADSSTASTSSYTPSAFSTASDTPSSFEAPSYTPSSSTSSYTPSTSSTSSWAPTTTTPAPSYTPSSSTPAGTSAGSSSFVVDSMENANGSASLAALAHGSDSAASSTGTGDASASSALKVDSPTVPSLGPIDIPDLSFPSFDFDTSTTTRKHDE